jgi:hypothetical protein
MFKLNLPLPSADEIRAFRRDADAMGVALKLRADIVRAVQLIQPETLLALARQHFSGEADFHALAKFGLELSAMLRELAEHGEDMRSIAGAEAECLAPLVATATRRIFEIPSKLEAVKSQLRHMDVTANERRENLRKAGVTGEDLERLMAEGADERTARRTSLNAEHLALLAEKESLARFLKTRDEQYLPAGFTASEPIKASATLPALPEMPALYRVAA